MTTFTLQGLRQVWVDTDRDGVDDTAYYSEATFELVTAFNTASYTFTYVSGSPFEAYPDDGPNSRIFESRIDGDTEDDEDTLRFLNASNDSGFNADILLLEFDEGTNFFFSINGDELPLLPSHADYVAFADSMTLAPITGSFGPGQVIPFSSWGNVTVTEDDRFFGHMYNNTFLGRVGNDTFYSSQGNDTFSGGAGIDTVFYLQDYAGVTVNLGARTATDGWGDTDRLFGIEIVVGSSFDDSLTGNGKKNS
jgi:Ca2+-binding RTX toxin-like protein